MTSEGDTEWAAVLLTRNCLPVKHGVPSLPRRHCHFATFVNVVVGEQAVRLCSRGLFDAVAVTRECLQSLFAIYGKIIISGYDFCALFWRCYCEIIIIAVQMFVIMNIVGVVYFYWVYCICKCLSFVQFNAE